MKKILPNGNTSKQKRSSGETRFLATNDQLNELDARIELIHPSVDTAGIAEPSRTALKMKSTTSLGSAIAEPAAIPTFICRMGIAKGFSVSHRSEDSSPCSSSPGHKPRS